MPMLEPMANGIITTQASVVIHLANHITCFDCIIAYTISSLV